MTYDWRNITENKIINLMKEIYIILKNNNQIYTSKTKIYVNEYLG
jgi:hypothetical protein